MKKTISLLATVLLFISLLNAQITGGSVSENTSSSPSVIKEKEVFKNYWNIYLHTASPMGKMGTAPSSIENISSSDLVDGNLGMGFGSGINIGQTFYLNNVNFGDDRLKLGIEATYLNFVLCFNNSTMFTESERNNYLYSSSFFLAAKLGPSISFNPHGNLIIGAKFCLEPTLYSIYIQTDYDDWNREYVAINATASLLRKSMGVYIRNRPFYVGFDIGFGSGIFTDAIDYEDESEFPDISYTTTRFDLIFGFSF